MNLSCDTGQISLRSFERMQAMCLFLRALTVIKIQMRAAKTTAFPGPFSMAWGCSENYVNLALAEFFHAIKIKCSVPSYLADTV